MKTISSRKSEVKTKWGTVRFGMSSSRQAQRAIATYALEWPIPKSNFEPKVPYLGLRPAVIMHNMQHSPFPPSNYCAVTMCLYLQSLSLCIHAGHLFFISATFLSPVAPRGRFFSPRSLGRGGRVSWCGKFKFRVLPPPACPRPNSPPNYKRRR
jgi:hypothetical protein